MERSSRTRILGTLAAAAALALSTAPGMAAAAASPRPAGYTCTGGEIPSGTYGSITVTGMCGVGADAEIHVVGNIDVTAGAMLDAQSAPATITVGHNVTAAADSFLGLGCQSPAFTGNSGHECAIEPEGHSDITVHGNVSATDASTVMLNGITVMGNVSLDGGGSFIPWSVKNNTVNGNISVSGQTAEWLGVMFNDVGRNVNLSDITVVDEHPGAPGVYIVRNHVGWNLNCWNLAPGVSGGFFPGSVNTVGHKATGQCADLV